MKTKQIVFTGVNEAKLLEKELPQLKPNSVLVKTVFSTISGGTEKANITGDINISAVKTYSKATFPRSAGYSSSGIVEAVGEDVKSVQVGDRVAMIWSQHQGYNLLPEDRIIKLESEALSLESAALGFISTFPLAAIRKTKLEIGESALVMGLGILGILAVKLLKIGGAVPIIAADPNPARRTLALQSGADYAFDPMEPDFASRVKEVSGGGVNVAIEVTGVGAGLNGALDCMAKFGRVALLGCTRNSDFTVDYYHKIHGPGITLIGAHTLARPEKESYPGYFTHQDDMRAVLKLCAMGRLKTEDLISETHSPVDCGEVYGRLVFDRDFPVGVQFDWRCLDE